MENLTVDERIVSLETDVERLKQRNRRVGADKAWETSMFRKITIIVLTYTVAVLVMTAIGVQNVFLNALIPTIGYFLSTQTIPVLKQWYLENRYKPSD